MDNNGTIRDALRKTLMNLYGVDIAHGTFHIANMYSFLIEVQGKTFRLVANSNTSDSEHLARIMWAEDLKLFKDTICDAIPSKNHKMIEKIQVSKWAFSVTLYETAKGHSIKVDDIRPMFLICAGDQLGSIHSVSTDQSNMGMKFKLPSIFDHYDKLKESVWHMINPDLHKALDRVVNEAKDILQTSDNYGVCFIEFSVENLMVDTNNIHMFDYDLSGYSYYLYDVATLFLSILNINYLPNRGSKDVLFNNLIPWFRIGYSINKPCDSNSFDNIDIFIRLRLVMLLMGFVAQSVEDKEEGRDRIRHIMAISNILRESDLYKAIDKHLRKR